MVRSLGDDQTRVKVQNRTGFELHSHDHDHDCGGTPKVNQDLGDQDDKPGVKHYVSLHHHSTYSFLDGYGLPKAHVRRAAELGMDSLALTEHGNIGSHVQLEVAAQEVGVKPIFGVELYMGHVDEQRRTQRKNHLTVMAQDQAGYQNLLRLVTRSWDQFHYEPTASLEDLEEFNSGLVVLSGCTGSWLSTALIGGKNIDPADSGYKKGLRVARRFQSIFGDRYFLEVQAFPELPNVCELNVMMERISRQTGIPLVATGDVHYTQPSENEIQQILHNVRGGNRKTLEEQAREWGYNVPLSPPTSDGYIYKRLRRTGLSHNAARSAIMNTRIIADGCNVTLPKLKTVKYPVPAPYKNSDEMCEAWIKEGWVSRGIRESGRAGEYVKRLKYEMEIIRGKDYLDYFLIVADVVKFAKRRGIPVGPARGSAAASLVCYLLEITEVDPLRFPNLLFERFISPDRADLPDIDLDFDDQRRHEIREYLVAKYGDAQVGNIGTLTMYKSKLALDDTARVYRIPKWQVETVKGLLIERSSGDLRADSTIEDTAAMFEEAAEVFKQSPKLARATLLEGQVKGMGVHAAGMVVSSEPLTQACAQYSRKVNGRPVSVLSVDKKEAEYLNILKIDVLGLKTLGMIANCLEMIGKPLSWLYEIPLDDPVTQEGFKQNDCVGIFQFDGRAMRQVTGELKPDNFLEVCDITALARPGPLHNGAAGEYIDVKRGRRKPRQYHPIVQDILDHTHGQVVYQEQILRIMGEVGGFGHTHRSTIRKIISKKEGEQEFNRWWKQFLAGAQERGLAESEAQAIWSACITAGSYAFNVAHSIAYGMLAWWTMYLKQHHMVEFYTASLKSYSKEKYLELLRDAVRHGVVVLPPDPARCGRTWSVVGPNEIMGGFEEIPGIGGVTAERIVEAVEDGTFKTWDDLLTIKGIGKKTVDKMREFCQSDDPFEITKLERQIKEVRRELGRGALHSLPMHTHWSIDIPYAKGDTAEVVWLGVITQRNLKELFEMHFSKTGETLDPAEVKDPELNEWVVMWGDDGTDVITIRVDRWNYPRLRQGVWSIKPNEDLVLIKGSKRAFESRRAIYVHELWVLGGEEEE
jgi:DNA polymerase III subunit alpha